jgi:hypothetical protein
MPRSEHGNAHESRRKAAPTVRSDDGGMFWVVFSNAPGLAPEMFTHAEGRANRGCRVSQMRTAAIPCAVIRQRSRGGNSQTTERMMGPPSESS